MVMNFHSANQLSRLVVLGGEQLRQTHSQSLRLFIYRFNFYYYCFPSVNILLIKNCVGLIMDYFPFKTILVSFLLMSNRLSSYLIIWKTLIWKERFFSKFYDNNVSREEQ